MRRPPAAGDTIINDRWTAGDDKEGSRQEQTTTNHCALKAGERRPVERAVSNEKGKDDADEERMSEEEEDYNNNKEENCAAATAVAAAAAVPAAGTAAATAGRHASFAATASDQAVAAVAAVRHSGLRRCTVAAAADSRMPLLTPVFSCFLSVCVFHVAQNTMFHLYTYKYVRITYASLRNSGRNS